MPNILLIQEINNAKAKQKIRDITKFVKENFQATLENEDIIWTILILKTSMIVQYFSD